MEAPAGGPPEAYILSCATCGASFDAMQASWCDCIVTRRSLVCPSCHACFCKAKPAYKQGFWQAAPKALWDRASAQHRPPELPENPDPGAVKRPLVLIVDDELDIQRMAAVAVEIAGYGVVRARNGQEGLELARLYKPDLVLADAFMPKLDGREMCRLIKEDPSTAGATVVVMTSLYTASRYKYEAFKEYRADDYLTKPLELDTLQNLLRKHLGEPSSR